MSDIGGRSAQGGREQALAALVEQVPAALGAYGLDGEELITNTRYRELVARGLDTVPLEAGEREVSLGAETYLAVAFPIVRPRPAGDAVPDADPDADPDAGAATVGHGEVLIDVTRRRLRAISAAMLELDQLKSDLVTTVSHELRTPLSSILGYCELLADGEFGELDPTARGMIDVIARNSRRLSRLLADLLLLAQLDSATADGAWDRLDLAELLREVSGVTAGQAEAAGLRVDLDVPAQADPLWLHGDRAQLRHALLNLASNAIKFSRASGSVRFHLAVDGTDALLEVIDDGVGIHSEDLPRLADRFYRTTAARIEHVQGAGVGLSVVQAIAARHHGELQLDSRHGEGTTARMRLPLTTSGPRAAAGAGA